MILATAPNTKAILSIINGLSLDGQLLILATPSEPIYVFEWQLFQVRMALLALKPAEIEWMKLKTGQFPVLLLDEVLANLDIQHRADLLA